MVTWRLRQEDCQSETSVGCTMWFCPATGSDQECDCTLVFPPWPTTRLSSGWKGRTGFLWKYAFLTRILVDRNVSVFWIFFRNDIEFSVFYCSLLKMSWEASWHLEAPENIGWGRADGGYLCNVQFQLIKMPLSGFHYPECHKLGEGGQVDTASPTFPFIVRCDFCPNIQKWHDHRQTWNLSSSLQCGFKSSFQLDRN